MNRLANETSPYLRQHRDNPVDWYPWGDDAFTRARAEDKPIFLSVGYSACHWCHVMAHESFEDPEIAAVMNRLFVNVKVDREERPDVDAVYMQAVQAMTGRGGWPMSVWLAPDGRPFYGGTYYPNADRQGMPGFTKVCEAVADAWSKRRDELLEQAERLTEAIDTQLPSRAEADELTAALLGTAYEQVRAQFEPRYGGFGRAPKFPQAMALDFVARVYVRNRAPETLTILTTSLDAMAAGGMYDQLGGGFARYSTDDFWLVPHFEKMLYDNALLTRAYVHGFQLTAEPRYRRIVEETVGYVLRDLAHPDGGFFSAEDADSEGVEGKFYCWDLAEIDDIAGADAPEVIRYYGVTEAGNFLDPHTGFRGNILHVVDRTEEPSDAILRGRERLFAQRATRARPGLDDKVLLGWNAMFLDALTEAAAAFDRADWMDRARANARFLVTELQRPDGRLVRSWRAPYLAYAEDYAALLEALCTLAEYDDPAWLRDALRIADALVDLFHDDDEGGFFSTGRDAEELIVRPKDLFDDATPSANSLAAHGLLRLAALTGDTGYEQYAVEVLRLVGPAMTTHPTHFAHALNALERYVTAPLEIAIIGPAADPATQALRAEVTRRLLPASVMLAAPAADPANPLLADRALRDGAPAAYVCEAYTCRRPVTTPEELRTLLDETLAGRPGQQAAT